MTTLPTNGAGESSEDRHDRLANATARLRRRVGFPVADWFQTAGWLLIPLGVALILLGWYGASRTTRTWQQIPYLISGGLLGLGLMLVGGFGFISSWLTRLVEESRRQATQASEAAARTAAALERIEALLGGAEASEDVLVTTVDGTLAHRPDCPLVAGKPNLRRVRAGDTELQPCGVCEPAMPERDGHERRPAGRRRR